MHTFTTIIHRSLLISLFLIVSACSSIKPQQTTDTLDDKLNTARVVHIGETHTNYAHHLNQLEIIRKSHKKWGGVISIGLEMVQQPFQSYLDDYIAGNISEREMLRGVEWYSRWRYDYRLYRPIFDYAKQNKIPLVALNIPQELTKKISRSGMESLTIAERKQLPTVIDKSNAEYTARLRKIFGMHSHGKNFNEKGFNKFVDAQLAWDEGMAFAASKYLKKHTKKRMVILAGSGHLINRAGIPNRLDRELSLSTSEHSLVILSHDEKEYTRKEADFSLATKDIKLEAAGLIGIGMKNSKQGVRITRIAKTGAPKKAGLLKDDLLLMLNNEIVKSTSDVNLWRLDKKPNEKVIVQLRRGKQLLTKHLTLGAPAPIKK